MELRNQWIKYITLTIKKKSKTLIKARLLNEVDWRRNKSNKPTSGITALQRNIFIAFLLGHCCIAWCKNAFDFMINSRLK